MTTNAHAYTATLTNVNVKIQKLLEGYGRANDESGLIYTVYLTDQQLQRIEARYPQIEFARTKVGVGGWRPGTGRKSQNTQCFDVCLPPPLEFYARQIGRGNRSKGIRRALEYYRQRHDP